MTSVQGADWMTTSTNSTSGRYDNIFFPITDIWMVQGVIFRQNIIQAPKTYFAKTSKPIAVDFCGDARIALAEKVPKVWNNSNVVFPCKEYFCSSAIPALWSGNSSNEFIEPGNLWFENPDVLHKMAQNWCTLCSASSSEEFPQVLKNTTCPWFNATCDGHCPEGVPCVYFNNRHSMCYIKDNGYNRFLTKVDGFHHFFLAVRILVIPWIFFIVNLGCLIVNVFCVVLPESKSLISIISSREISSVQKFKAIFSLRNQAAFIEVAMNIMFIIGGFIDIINFLAVNFTSYLIFVHFGGTIYTWALLIILWRHIENQSEGFSTEDNLSRGLKIVWVCVIVVGAIFGLLGILLFVINVSLVGTTVYLVSEIGLLIYCASCGLFTGIVSIGLIIVAIRLFCKLSPPTDPLKMAGYLFQLKLTRSIILFTSFIPVTLWIAGTAIIQLFWIDLLSIQYYVAVHGPLYCLVSVFYSILTAITLIHNENFEKFWRPGCCCNKERSEIENK